MYCPYADVKVTTYRLCSRDKLLNMVETYTYHLEMSVTCLDEILVTFIIINKMLHGEGTRLGGCHRSAAHRRLESQDGQR